MLAKERCKAAKNCLLLMIMACAKYQALNLTRSSFFCNLQLRALLSKIVNVFLQKLDINLCKYLKGFRIYVENRRGFTDKLGFCLETSKQ